MLLLRDDYDVAVAAQRRRGQGLAMARQEPAAGPGRPGPADAAHARLRGVPASSARWTAELKAVKVLISSSKSYQHDVNTAVDETGADGYIVKPFEIADFKGRVAALLGEKA